MYAIPRTPSHLISYAQLPSSCGSSPVRASIGLTCSGIGSRSGSSGGSIRWIIQFLAVRPEQDVAAATRSPWKVTITSLSRHLCVS